jgi:hypothetical protein
MKALLLFVGLMLTIGILTPSAVSPPSDKRKKERSAPVSGYRTELRTPADFDALMGGSSCHKFSDVQSVLMVYEIATDRVTFFSNRDYPDHYAFCKKELGCTTPETEFYAVNAAPSAIQQYWLATLNYYRQANMYAIEFTCGAEPGFQDLRMVYHAAIGNSFLENNVGVLINSDHLCMLDENGEISVPRVYPSRIYGEQKFQALYPGECYGVLRKVDDLDLRYGDILSTDIILLDKTPVELPLCTGLIITHPQAPLSQLGILVDMRHIITAVDVDALENKVYDLYAFKPVKLTVTADSISIEPATMKQVEAYAASRVAKEGSALFSVTGNDLLLPLVECGFHNIPEVGAGAAALGEMKMFGSQYSDTFEMPAHAFVIPFSFYGRHISQPGVANAIAALDSNKVYREDYDSLSKQLACIRFAIMETPLSTQLLTDIIAMMNEGCNSTYVLSSATNEQASMLFQAADESTVINDGDGCSIEMAIKEQWVRQWKEKVWRTRLGRGIDPLDFRVAVTIREKHPDEACSGIAFAENIYQPGRDGFSISALSGNGNVLYPADSVICEQMVCIPNPATGRYTIDYITHGVVGEKPVITREQVFAVCKAVDRLESHFAAQAGYMENDRREVRLGVRFSFDGDHHLYLHEVFLPEDYLARVQLYSAKR